MNEEIEKQLSLLERVAEKLKNGLITSGNVAHDGMVQGYTIENVVNNIRKVLNKEAMEWHNKGYVKGVEDAYHNVNEARSIINRLKKNERETTSFSEGNGII